MFNSKGVVYVVRYMNMYHDIEIKAFKTAHDAAEWVSMFSEDFLANDAEMRMEVLPLLASEPA